MQGRMAGAATVFAAVLAVGGGCTHRAPTNPAMIAALQPPVPPAPGPSYRIQIGDQLHVRFLYQPDMSEELPVRPDGCISLLATGELDVVGLTPTELAARRTGSPTSASTSAPRWRRPISGSGRTCSCRAAMVGPRPVRPVFLATSVRDIRRYTERFRIRPGMTGLAQLRGGYFTHTRDKLRYDRDRIYMAPRGFWLDFKLVVVTFVKLLNRWLTLGVLLGLTFLCASFVPAVFRAPFQISVGGFHLSPFEATGLLLAGVVLVRQIPAHRLYLYRTPTNRPMVCYLVFSIVAGLLAGDISARLRDVAYFTASGFLLFFLVVSGEITEEFAIRATRVVALAAVAVALLGILEVVVENHASAALGPETGTPRITATLGSPVAVAAYLVLGMPLVLVELSCAERREERDFWLVCTTLVIVGVLLTQTRTGLIALWLTGSVFAWRVSRRMFQGFAGVTLVFAMLMAWTGGLRLSPNAISAEWARRVSVTNAAISSESGAPLAVLLGPEPGKGAVSLVGIENGGEHHRVVRSANMHLTLVQRTGLIGWALMMWVIGSALVAIFHGSNAVSDRRLGLVLWAIFSSGLGFLVSMSNFNAFYDATIQIFFWGLLGIGMAIAVHQSGRQPVFSVIWRFGPRD